MTAQPVAHGDRLRALAALFDAVPGLPVPYLSASVVGDDESGPAQLNALHQAATDAGYDARLETLPNRRRLVVTLPGGGTFDAFYVWTRALAEHDAASSYYGSVTP